VTQAKPFWEAIILTAGVIALYLSVVYLGNLILNHKKIHSIIMPNKSNEFTEFKIFKFAIYALLAGWMVLTLLEWWGVPVLILHYVRSLLVDGKTLYGINIVPARLLIALLVFSVIQMSWKYFLLYLSKVRKFDPEADSQIVITSLLSYLVLAIAILCGLSVSGVDFTGLAIVAGALSVGIGLGLQNIVNNFVSGVILLIEKPIKPGDRVLIQGKEGFVKKISFRYTRIVTLMKENVIIPNSDLMTTPIINYEFDDKIAKLKCSVGVAYGSDIEQVKQVLLNLAIKHPEVLRDPVNEPMVYLMEFGESNIYFELVCVVEDVNRKSIITSDLYFMIFRAFKDNNIAMAFPQRDVHIKQGA
jgi:small-conductance mechanosensitive channel